MIDWPLVLIALFGLGGALFIVYCIGVLIFAKPQGDPVEPVQMDTVDLMMFHDTDQN